MPATKARFDTSPLVGLLVQPHELPGVGNVVQLVDRSRPKLLERSGIALLGPAVVNRRHHDGGIVAVARRHVFGVGVQRRRRVPVDGRAEILAGKLACRPPAEEFGLLAELGHGRPIVQHRGDLLPAVPQGLVRELRLGGRLVFGAGVVAVAGNGRFQIGRSLGIFPLAQPGHAAESQQLGLFWRQPNGLVEPGNRPVIIPTVEGLFRLVECDGRPGRRRRPARPVQSTSRPPPAEPFDTSSCA